MDVGLSVICSLEYMILGSFDDLSILARVSVHRQSTNNYCFTRAFDYWTLMIMPHFMCDAGWTVQYSLDR